ncbi:MAG: quinol:cytochrome C oxidoreductase [Cyclobacteriaceae bacterium]|nr:quinol:cytochrome C oxidoreductase [Cyclobacteriaceae bacterium]MCH8515174.1 quinol:cytochrome C oxidoreductase [Cyclobacteriaceae bacterium]
MTEERFDFTSGAKKKLIITFVVGFALLAIGLFFLAGSDAAVSEEGKPFHWTNRLWTNLWINNVYFTGLAIIGVFFVAIQYVARAGWSAYIIRIPLAFGSWLPFAGVLMLGIFLIANHDLFHWTHTYLFDKEDPRYDKIIAGKEPYLNMGFFLARMVGYFVIWYLLFRAIKKHALAEDINGGTHHYRQLVKFSAIFIVLFAITSSTSAWDWVLSIDAHWFSTMFGWYVFASWWVNGIAAILLGCVLLKEAGYLPHLNRSHIHDLGKFLFGFSIFWTYIWFSQFLLIYYANIPEETFYFIERLNSDYYSNFFFINLVLNFLLPFLVLMTREAKRQAVIVKFVCVLVLFGHWLDFYLMITPGTLSTNGGFGFIEIGSILIYLSAFLFVSLTALSKSNLIPNNHPMLEESIHHEV